jgi:hypothetical protein
VVTHIKGKAAKMANGNDDVLFSKTRGRKSTKDKEIHKDATPSKPPQKRNDTLMPIVVFIDPQDDSVTFPWPALVLRKEHYIVFQVMVSSSKLILSLKIL